LLTEDGAWMLDFYAPWCGHCKRLTAPYEEAATAMAGKVHFGKIDCTQNAALKSRFKIRGFPTLMFWRDGAGRDYKGGRTAEALVAYAKKVSGKAVAVMPHDADFNALETAHPVAFVFLGNKDSAAYAAFKKTAEKHQGVYHFAAAHEEALAGRLATEAELSAPSSGTSYTVYVSRTRAEK
jgi:protein disulfide-isomerase-like protein